MKIEVNYHSSFLLKEEHDPEDVFINLKKKFKFHVYRKDLERVLGMTYDESNIKFLKKACNHLHNGLGYQNYLCQELNMLEGKTPITYNRYSGRYFKFVDDGWRSIFKISKVSKKVRIPSGWLGPVINYLLKAYPRDSFPDFCLDIEDKRKGTLEYEDSPIYRLPGMPPPYPFQKEVIGNLIDVYKGIRPDGKYDEAYHYRNSIIGCRLLKLAVNSGKTYISALHAANLPNNSHVFVFVKQVLFQQAVADYLEMGFDVSVICADEKGLEGYLETAEIEKRPSKGFGDVLMIMVPTYLSRVDSGEFTGEELLKYDVIYADECQLLATDDIKKFYSYTRPVLKLSYSGTPFDMYDKAKRLEVRNLYGPVFYERSTKENIEDGISLQPIVEFYLNDPGRSGLGRLGIKQLKETYIYGGEERFKALCRALDNHPNEQTVIYIGANPLKVGKDLYDRLCPLYNKVAITDGTKKGDLPGNLKLFKKGDTRILIINKIFREGINLKNLEFFVNWEASDNKLSLIQAAIGRSVRKFEGMKYVFIADFYDNIPVFDKRSDIRQEIYQSEENSGLCYDMWEAPHVFRNKLVTST